MQKKGSRALLWYEVGAFGLLIAISWADELFGLPRLLFGGLHTPNIREAIFETIVILFVAIPLVLHTQRVVTRVEHQGDWIPVAEFFQERFDTATSHGMCPACFAKQGHVGGAA